jgi:hypothetical protein
MYMECTGMRRDLLIPEQHRCIFWPDTMPEFQCTLIIQVMWVSWMPSPSGQLLGTVLQSSLLTSKTKLCEVWREASQELGHEMRVWRGACTEAR